MEEDKCEVTVQELADKLNEMTAVYVKSAEELEDSQLGELDDKLMTEVETLWNRARELNLVEELEDILFQRILDGISVLGEVLHLDGEELSELREQSTLGESPGESE